MTSMQWTVLALLIALALSVVAIIYALDLSDDRRKQGAYRATWRQRRAWRIDRTRLNPNLKGRH